MNRSERRREYREVNRIKSKMYTYEECQTVALNMVKETHKKYDARYSLCLATALNAPPLNFGKKRICDVVKLFFDQVSCVNSGIITEEQLREEGKKLGILVEGQDDTLAIYIDPTLKFKKEE